MTDLPGPDYPHPVVAFDGVCNLCNGWVSFLISHDRQRIFRFATLQGRVGAALAAGAAPSNQPVDSIVLFEQGRTHTRSTAALRILRRLGLPWSAASLLLIVPRPIRDAVYDFVARRRYRWFGRASTCRVPTALERSVFLD